MRKTLLSILILLLVVVETFSQEIEVNLPSYNPTSPEAASLGQYGRIANSSSTGQMNYSVPLYTIPLKMGSWNVSLNYHYSGLLLDGDPSITGLGWTLLASGVVNREVRGLKDESRFGYYGVESKRSIIQQYMAEGDMIVGDRRRFKNKEWDSEADLYTVSVAGLNFSFKLDAQDNPIFLSKHAHKVAIDRNPQTKLITSFTVTDIQGVVYFFNVKEASISLPYINEDDVTSWTDTSWLLKSVTYPNAEQLTFLYDSKDNIDDYHHSYSFSAAGAALFGRTASGPGVNGGSQVLLHGYSDGTRGSLIHRKTLKQIVFPKGVVDFTMASNDRLYSNVSVKNIHQQVIQNYQFTYEGVRDLLVGITNKLAPYYTFEYHGQANTNHPEQIPGFIDSVEKKALNKDRWGYYNGAQNQYAINIPNTIYTADINPSFLNTQKGALKKIYYPTGGHTEVTYAQNQIMTKNVIGSDYYANLEMACKGSDPLNCVPNYKTLKLEGDYLDGSAPNYKEAVMTLDFEYPTVIELSHSITGTRQGSHIFMDISKIGGGCNYLEYYPADFVFPNFNQNYNDFVSDLRAAIVQYTNGNPETTLNPLTPFVCPQLAEEYGPDDGSAEPNQIFKNGGGRMVVLPGTYQFKIYTTKNRETNATAEIKVRMQKDRHIPPPTFANIDVGGIRVAKLTDCTSESGDCTERAFNYNDANGLSTGSLATEPLDKIVSKRRETYCLVASRGGICPESITYLKTNYHYSTSYYSALDPAFGTPVYYSAIEEKQLGDTNIGYQKRTFRLPVALGSDSYPRMPNGRDLSGAKLANSFSYDASDELVHIASKNYTRFIRNSETIYNYPLSLKVYPPTYAELDFIRYSYDQFLTDDVLHSTNANIMAIKELYPIETYKEVDYDFKLEKDIQNTIFGDNIVVSGQKIEYNNTNYLSSKISRVKDRGEEGLILVDDLLIFDTEKNITYPLDIINPTDAEINLISENRLSTPIKITTYKIAEDESKTLLATNLVEHINWSGNVVPKHVKSSKGASALEDRVVYHRYDLKGNPLEVSQKDGTQMVYIWGYQESQPIAKIVNATYTQVASYVTNLQNLSNQDNDRTLGTAGNEGALRTALNNLRGVSALANAQITTYTYDPLIGVTSITDPSGQVVYYQYDAHHRLQFVKDKDGNILKENQYHYKN